MTIFTKESEFENALIEVLTQHGWEKDVIEYPTEEDLIQNWAQILFNNNLERDRLNGCPLTNGEMAQILAQIQELKTPLKLNAFINGKTVSIKRDNPEDTEHFGKEVSLKIYDRQEIAAGSSRYQIVRQPQFKKAHPLDRNRRGDVMLLINGMPVIHIELKKHYVNVSEAYIQIERYVNSDIFSGLFSLVQIFVAMTPEETVYFANNPYLGRGNRNYYFHWEDFNNEVISDWKEVAIQLLSIPMAHQMIGFYTVADKEDGFLKVMRSYQYYAASQISAAVSRIKWGERNQRGGHIWHTTGSGKTMTSFKSAELIATSQAADKVVFLMDRIELGNQSLREYRSFADASATVQQTESASVLKSKLLSTNPQDTLIVTSIQKLSRIKQDEDGINEDEIEKLSSKRIVFIVDEAHRSTFGEMLSDIRRTFPYAIFFGFTGTPIHEENSKKNSTTVDIFGDELHRYTIADGIRDKNVLGFCLFPSPTFNDEDIREKVALHEAKARDIDDVYSDPAKEKIYHHFMDDTMKMAGYYDKENNRYIKGIEDYIPDSQYKGYDDLYSDKNKESEGSNHQKAVVQNIKKYWKKKSRNERFHAILATSSIPEAIKYYRLFKCELPEFKVTAVFDSNFDNVDGYQFKEDGILEIIDDYYKRYGQFYTLESHHRFREDVRKRLAHKDEYRWIDKTPEKQLDLVIVVNQLLTGYDSKWVNTLYLDKVMEYEMIIQAFSRTNRIFGIDKPFGSIVYYRKPNTMDRNVERALELYSGNKPLGLFVSKLPENISALNNKFNEIEVLFEYEKVPNFSRLPETDSAIAKFAKLFKELVELLEMAQIQGFDWTPESLIDSDTGEILSIDFDEETYNKLLLRYKEIEKRPPLPPAAGKDSVVFDVDPNIRDKDARVVDYNYLNDKFNKFIKALGEENTTKAREELHYLFASLDKDDQIIANIILTDIESGNLEWEEGCSLSDYMNSYRDAKQEKDVDLIVSTFGLDKRLLLKLMKTMTPEEAVKSVQFYELVESVDEVKAQKYFDKQGKTLKGLSLKVELSKKIREIIQTRVFEL